MKKLALLLILTLALALVACTPKAPAENEGDTKQGENIEAPANESDKPDIEPDFEWEGDPVETPIIPPSFAEDGEIITPEGTEELPETEEPSGPVKIPESQIVPEPNELPAIPIE